MKFAHEVPRITVISLGHLYICIDITNLGIYPRCAESWKSNIGILPETNSERKHLPGWYHPFFRGLLLFVSGRGLNFHLFPSNVGIYLVLLYGKPSHSRIRAVFVRHLFPFRIQQLTWDLQHD